MKKLFLILLLLLPSTALGYFEISDGVPQILSPDGTRTLSLRPIPTAGINIDWIWPLGFGAAGQALVTDGATNVLEWSSPSASGHNLLSANHTDTVTDTVSRGSLIYGNATPKWGEKTIGVAGTVLISDGTDFDWSATTSITTLGTIVTGVWQATDVDVPYGGTGVSSLTDGGILLGSGSTAITALGVAANGQIPIGDGATDPVLATLTEGLAIDVTNGAGAITLDFDPTELSGNRTWGDASTDTIVWTWDRATGTDPAMTFGNDFVSFNGDLKILGDDLFMTTNTNRFVLMGDGTNYNPEEIDLGTDTAGNYVASITDGDNGIDGGDGGSEAAALTLSFDPTELDALNWSDGTNASNVWTYNVSGTDHTMTAGNGLMTFSHALTVVGTMTGGTLTDGTATLTDGNLTGMGNITGSDVDLSLGTGDYSSSGTITSGDITIFGSAPILVFKDSDGAGSASTGFIEWRDSGGGRAGFFGNSSSGNDDLLWKNEQGGNIQIQTTGAGEFQIFANTVLNNNSITGIDNLTAGGTITGGTLTDGTAIITGGEGTGFTKIEVDDLTFDGVSIMSSGSMFINTPIADTGTIIQMLSDSFFFAAVNDDFDISADGGNINLTSFLGTKITAVAGDIALNAAFDLNITSGTNQDTTITTSGTGKLIISGDMQLNSGDFDLNGGLDVSGTLGVSGNVILLTDLNVDGDTTLDKLTAVGDDGAAVTNGEGHVLTSGLGGTGTASEGGSGSSVLVFGGIKGGLRIGGRGGKVGLFGGKGGIGEDGDGQGGDIFLETETARALGFGDGTFGDLYLLPTGGKTRIGSSVVPTNLVSIAGAGKIDFRDNAIGIYSQADGFLDLFADGAVRIGDSSAGAPTNYSEFESDGTLKFNGDATVFGDINIAASTLSGPPGKQPGIVNYLDENGSNTGIATFGLAVGEGFSGQFEMQHDYLEGSDITFHYHWQGIAAPTGTDNVQIQLTYTVSVAGATLDPVTVIVKEEAFDTQYEFKTSSFSVITGTDINIEDQFMFTFERIAASANEYGGEALIATVGIHYEKDMAGSRQILVK